MKRLFPIIALMIVSSCHKKAYVCTLKPASAGYLVFGTAYGECGGDCAHMYLVKDGALYADSINSFYTEPLRFQSSSMPGSKYLAADSLRNEFPDWLKNNTDTVIGCPDCRDQGLYYFEYANNGIVKKWRVDPDSVPQQAQAFFKHVDAVMNSLK